MLTRHSERELFFLGTTHLTPPEASRQTGRVREHREPKERWEDPGYLHAVRFLFFCQKTFLSQMTLTHTPIGWEDPGSSASIGGPSCPPQNPPMPSTVYLQVFCNWQNVLENLRASQL